MDFTAHIVSKIPEQALKRGIKWASNVAITENSQGIIDQTVCSTIGFIFGLMIGIYLIS